MIQQTFRVTNGSCEMLKYKRKSLISDTTAEKKLNTIVNKAVDADKRQDTIARKKSNTAAELSILIKNQITKRTELEGQIRVR